MIDGSKPADIVIGQSSMSNGSCNGDSLKGMTGLPTASTLCLTAFPYGTNAAEQWGRVNIDVDAAGNLYVPDIYNNRVLKYNTPFTTDTVADYVWGQADFTSSNPNMSVYRTIVGTPTSSSLWLSGFPANQTGMAAPAAWGVSVDASNTVWVADTYNGRVLSFVQNQKAATNVVGKANFTTRSCDTGAANRLCTPLLAKKDPATGELYVLEAFPGLPFQTQFKVFPATITNGVAATSTFAPIQPGDWENWDGYGNNNHYFFQGTGFAFNPVTTGGYANGKLWVNEHAANRTILITSTGTMITAVGAKSLTLRGGDSQYGGVCGSMYDGFRMGWPGGSIGFDSENNMYLADEWRVQVSRYALPYTLQGNGCLPDPTDGAMQGKNLLTSGQIGETVGFAMYGNDLIVKDRDGWLKVWPNYQTGTSGSNSSFIVNGAGTRRQDRLLMSQAIDGQNRLWTIGEHGTIDAFQLPLSANSTPVFSDIKLHWADNNAAIAHLDRVHNITYSPTEQALYFVDQGGSRILRVKNLTTLATGKLYVDLAIGVSNKTDGPCATEPEALASTTRELCRVWGMKVDKLGNLYAIDNNYECHGNKRILVYDIASLNAATSLFSTITVKNIINSADISHAGRCAYGETDFPGSPVSLAFDSQNHMVVGNDGYYGDWKSRSKRQLFYYNDPLTQKLPTKAIDLIMGAPGEVAFDAQDNLLVQDHTWPKIYAINLTTNPGWLVNPDQSAVGDDYQLVFKNTWGVYPNWTAPTQFLYFPKYTFNVLSNDAVGFTYDAQNVVIQDPADHGQVIPSYDTATNTMSYQYVPDYNYQGYDDFTYKITSATGQVFMAKVNIAVMEFYIDYLVNYYNGGQYNGPVPGYLQGGFLSPGAPIAQKIVAPTASAPYDPAGEGLLSYWKFDETSGTTAFDTSVNHLDKTVTGAVWQAGRTNNGLYFDGVNDHVSLGNYDLTSNQVTFSLWINSTDLANCSGLDCRILTKASSANASDHYWMFAENNTNGSPTLRFRLKVNGTVQNIVSTNYTLQNNTWYHLAATYDGSKIYLYINGTQVGSKTIAGTIDKSSTVPAVIGAAPGAMNKRFKGTIDQVRIYSRALSATEITNLYNQGL